MGYEMLIGPEDEETAAFYLGSTSAVDALIQWMLGLPESEFPDIHVFARDFQTTDPWAVSDRLGEARDRYPPDADVDSLLRELGSTMTGLDPGTLFRIE